jgi:N-formylglutamate deformylase
MTDIYSFVRGRIPLLVSIPHDGRRLAPGQVERFTEAAKILPDTDWHVRQLYEFAATMGASVIAANYSRYVVDLNRPADDAAPYEGQVSTGLCPAKLFSGQDIYQSGAVVSANEQRQRVKDYWQPYHNHLQQTLADIREEFGYALLWDAHSIVGEMPSLFEGALPDLNIGTNDGKSCDATFTDKIMAVANESAYSAVVNERFRGGYITRYFGAIEKNVHAVQLELSQRNYMDEKTLRYDAARASKLSKTIEHMMHVFVDIAAQRPNANTKGRA